jgi:hypothetical protein
MTYKFKPINKWLFESLVNSTIYIPSLAELNDPFDCLIDIDFLFSKAVNHATRKNEQFIADTLSNNDFKKDWKLKVSNIGVYSCSIDESILKEHLMWSHYADKHTGVCIKYNGTFGKYINTDVGGKYTMLFNGAVSYGGENLEGEISNLPRKEPHFSEGLTEIYLSSKATSWAYEKEGRFVLSDRTILTLPTSCIDSIYFGLKTEDADVKLVTKLANEYSGCNTFYKAKRGDSYYDISFEKIST